MGTEGDVLLTDEELEQLEREEQAAAKAKERSIHDEDVQEPEDLPEAVEAQQTNEGQLIPDAGRICPKCGQEASRIVSNLLGRTGFCGPCKFDWPLGPPVAAVSLPLMGRNATGKQSLLQPNWDLAFEDIDPQGPK